jgi:hypothetical protein
VEPELILWLCLPLVLPLVIVLVARSERTQKFFVAVLLCLGVAGSLALLWGLETDKADFGYLILLLVPLCQFGFLAVLLAIYALLTSFRPKA